MVKRLNPSRLSARLRQPTLRQSAPFLAAAIVIGVVAIVLVRAAAPLAAFEPETGTLSGGASATTATGQSGTGVVRFGTPAPTPTPTPTPTGTQTTHCIPSDGISMSNTTSHLCGFPDSTNTGVPAGTTLTKKSGTINANTNGQIVENIDLTGEIDVTASNVIIRNVRVTYGGDVAPIYNTGSNLLVQDSELIGTTGHEAGGIVFGNYTARRVNVHGTADGLKAGGNVNIYDSYIHDIETGGGNHSDGIQNDGDANAIIQHNTILNYNSPGTDGATSCVLVGAGSKNITINNNLLDGGGYCIYLDGSGITYTNNHLGRKSQYGPYHIAISGFTSFGNVWDDTGAANNP